MREENRLNTSALLGRRSFFSYATLGMGMLAAGAGIYGLGKSLSPSTSDIPERWATKFDLRGLRAGEPQTIVSNGKPFFVMKLTDRQVSQERAVPVAALADPTARNDNLAHDALATVPNRTIEADGKYVVFLGLCPRLGCVPLHNTGNFGGWFCPCGSAHFDALGRVRMGPTSINLQVPRYRVSETAELMLVDWTEGVSEDTLDRLLYGRGQQG